MDKTIFASRLKEARKKKKIELQALREKVNISQSAMSHYSTGTTVPTLEVAAKLAEALGVSLDWLCGLSEESETQKNTCGYVARLMLKLEKVLEESHTGFLETSSFREKRRFAHVVISRNDTLLMFFDKKIRYEEMAKENIEAKEMYQAWLSGALNSLDNIILIRDKDHETRIEGESHAEKETGCEP